MKPLAKVDAAKLEEKKRIALRDWVEIASRVFIERTLDELQRTAFITDDEEEETDTERELDEIWNETLGLVIDEVLSTNPVIQGVSIKQTFPRRVLISQVTRASRYILANDKTLQSRSEIPGTDIRSYGTTFKTSSTGVWAAVKLHNISALLQGGYIRIAKSRIDPLAWSYLLGKERKDWRYHYELTDRDKHIRECSIPRGALSSPNPAIRALLNAGVVISAPDRPRKELLATFLRYRPKLEIIRCSNTGWVQDEKGHHIFVRPDVTLAPSNMPNTRQYRFEGGSEMSGLRVSGSVKEWQRHIAAPLEKNSNVALALATFFATPLLRYTSEQVGGWHIYGPSSIGKTLVGAIGQSIYGMPLGVGTGGVFGRTWQSTATGLEQYARIRSDVGMFLDEVHTGDPRPIRTAIYQLTASIEKLRATSAIKLRETESFRTLVYSTGEVPLSTFLGGEDTDGRKKRLVDVPAEITPGTAFETIPPAQIGEAGKRYYSATAQYHGAVGLAWQQHLVQLGAEAIHRQIVEHRDTWMKQPAIISLYTHAHPQVQSVFYRFGLMAAALRMAITAKMLPWSVQSADACILACAERWIAARGDINVTLRKLTDYIRDNIANTFVNLKLSKGEYVPSKSSLPDHLDGYIKDTKLLIVPEIWHRLVGYTMSQPVQQHLIANNLMLPGELPTKPRKERFGQKNPGRFYVLKFPDILSVAKTPKPTPTPEQYQRAKEQLERTFAQYKAKEEKILFQRLAE